MAASNSVLRKDSPIYVAGHTGLIGSALMRLLAARGYTNLITARHADLDLRDAAAVRAFLDEKRPECLFLAAAQVGGIKVNSERGAEFIYNNLMIETSVIQAAHAAGVRRLMFFGSTCTYPRACPQPMPEETMLTGELEQTSEPYAVAKLAGMKMCQAFRQQHGAEFFSVIPATVYGPGDNFDFATGHVMSSLIRRFHEAKSDNLSEVEVWGSGKPRREFIHADDIAAACLFLASLPTGDLWSTLEPRWNSINVGTGSDLAISELAERVARTVGYQGQIRLDPTKPDGTFQKLLDSTRVQSLGWHPTVALEAGMASTYQWYCDQQLAGAPTSAGRP